MALILWAIISFYQGLADACELMGFEGLYDIFTQIWLTYVSIGDDLAAQWYELGCDEYWD